MASLTGKTIANTYKDLLQTATSGTGLPVSTPTAIQDGQGNSSGLKLSQTQIDLTGTVKIKGTELTANVSALNAVADFTAVSGFATGNGAGTIVGRTFSASTGISISNADGISGNPTFSLAVTSVSPGTYAGQLTSFDIDATGRITGTNTTDTVSATNVNATNIAGTTGQFSGNVSIGGSLNFTGALAVDSLSVTGDIHGNNVNVSIVFADSLQVTNAVCATSFHGSGAALTSITAASATNASYAASAGEAAVAVSSSHALSATFAQTAEFANSATNSTNAVSAVFASSATNATSAVFATSATNATNAINVDYGGVVETSSANLGTVSASDMFVSGPVSVGGTVDVSGAVSIGGGLFVVGDVSAGNIYAGGILYGNGAGLFNVPSESGGTVNFVKAGTGIHVTEDGVTTTNPITASGTLALNADQSFGAVSATNLTISASATFEDSAALHFGTDKDLTIQHNGSNSLITESGTGSLFVQSNEIRLTNTGSFSMLTLTDGQDAEFPYGVQVSGTVSATSFVGPTITSINSVIAGVSSTLATSIGNTNSNLTALSATLATSIANHLPLAGGTMTGAITLSGAPTSNLEAATKQYVDNLTNAAIHFHDAVRVESPDSAGNLNATYDNGTAGVGATLTNAGTQAALVIDGVTLNTSDRVLIYNQTDATQNGVYTVTDTGSVSTNWVLTRATDADSYAPTTNDGLDGGSYFYVTEGDTGAGEAYVCNNIGEITFGTTDITFVQFSSALVYTAGSGININGSRVVSTSGVPTDAELAAVSATLATSISNHMPLAGGTFTGDVTWGDNNKAIFGAGSDLQIFHDGFNSVVRDAGTGHLYLQAEDFRLTNNGATATYMKATNSGSVELRHNNDVKFETTSGGIDVTGTVTADGLTSDSITNESGNLSLSSTQSLTIRFDSNNDQTNREFNLQHDTNTNILTAYESGDISFYDSTGVTQGFFWDASAQRLGLGNTSPTTTLDVTGTITADNIDIQGDGTISGGSRLTISDIADVNNDGIRLDDNTTSRYNNLSQDTSGNFVLQHFTGTAWQNNLTITSGGNVGIGTSSPNGRLQVTGGTTNASNLATAYSAAAFTLVPKSTSGFSLAFGSGPSDFPYIQMSAAGTVASNMSLQPYGGNVGIGTSSISGNDGTLIVEGSDGKHPIIKGNDGSGNGFTLLADNYLSTESQLNLGLSHSGSNVVLSRSCKVSDVADDTFLSSQDFYSTKPAAFTLDEDGSFRFYNTNTNATRSVDSTVTLDERMRIDSSGNVGIGKTPSNKPLEIYAGSNPAIRIQNSTTGTTNSDGFLIEQNGSNTLLVNYESGYQAFYTGGTERMHIDISGIDVTGTIKSSGYIQSGDGTGSVALTTNDGHGNANLTFNHAYGVPDVNGSSYRIETGVDSASASMNFDLASNTTAGVGVTLPTIMSLNPSGMNVNGDINAVDNIYLARYLFHEGDTDTYIDFVTANEMRVVTGNSESIRFKTNYIEAFENVAGSVETASKTGSVTPDMQEYNSFVWTLTGNITLANPTTELAGSSGVFIFIHSGAGRTVSLGSDWETAGGAGLTLSGTSGAVDIVPYFVQSSGNILLGTPQLGFA